jgi:cell division protein FtsW (lipid II flippase)
VILILFLVLLLAYLAAFLGADQRKDRRALEGWWIASTAVALLASGVFFWILLSAAQTKSATQIAWIGMATRSAEDPLEIGGSRQKSTVGWPNGAFSPSLSISEPTPGEATVKIAGGGGFVRGPQGFLNGIAVSEGHPVTLGRFGLDVESLPGAVCFRCRAVIRVLDGAKEVGRFQARTGGDPRVSSLYSNLAVDIARLRKTDGGAAQALESWSSNLRLMVSRGGVRVISPDVEPVSAQLKLPARLTVYWSGQSQPLELKPAGERRLEAVFLPPWRLASPMPEPTKEGDAQLTLEARALPGDFAFLLPLGGDLRNFNHSMSLKNAQFAKPDKLGVQEFEKVVSRETALTDKYALRFAAVHDLPSWRLVLACVGIALLIYGCGMWIASARMRWRDGWVLGGLLASVWTILLIRLLLAFRYALDPTHFDKFAFDGVSSAARALCLIPAFVLIAARLRRDRAALLHVESMEEKASAGWRVVAFLLGAIAASGVVTWLAHSLWPNVRERYSSNAVGLSSLFTYTLVALTLGWVCGYMFFLYFYDPDREASERFHAKVQELRARCFRRITETFALEQSEGLWRQLGSTLDDEDTSTQDYATRLKVLLVVLGSLIGAAVLIGGIGFAAGANEKFIQEVAAPFLLCWMPATVWLAARLHFRPGSRMSRRNPSWLVPWLLAATLLILAPVILFPVLLGDAGGIVATFAFFWPAVALLAAGGKPRRLQWMPMGALLITVLAAGVVYLNLDYVTKLPGEARVRLLIFKEGMNLQDRMPGLPMLREDVTTAPTVRQVSQGLQHTWENKAMAHEGGWTGLGFGKAPTRRSQVPQHTLQVDSTYSFYIASEFGILGGLALLCIYAMPLVWVLISARPRLDTGHGMAILIASAFLLEALFHAGMNLTAFPYTGRDLPLLAVGSFTDSVRWTLLFCLAVRALQWRAMGSDREEDFRTESIISPAALPGSADSAREPLARYRTAVIAVAALPVLMLSYTMFQAVQLVRDPELSLPFQWTRLLSAVHQAGEQGKLKVDPKTMTIEVADASLAQQGGTLMEQEIARFNALTESEKLEGVASNAAEFRKRLRQIRTVNDYDRLMQWMRTLDDEDRAEARPLLFRIVADPRTLDDAGEVQVSERSYQILPNPAFNTSVSFHEMSKDDIPAVALRGQASGTFVVRGRNFDIHLPNVPAQVGAERTVLLDESVNGSLRKIADSNPDGPEAKLQIRYKPEKKGRPQFLFGELRVAGGGLTFRPAVDSRLMHPGSQPKKIGRNVLEKLVPGDRVELAAAVGKNKLQPSFSVEKTAQGALIGPAWVMGNWVATYDPDPLIPWTANLANALPDEQAKLKKDLPARFGTLTFDKALQANLQSFTTVKGRAHYQEYLGTGAGGRQPLPPRVAISVISLPHGEVVGMGGWPRMNSSRHWDAGPSGDLIPPFAWVDRAAPHSLRIRYQGDRNFDRIAVGSASKPLWASAVLQMHRGLENRLDTQGEGEMESEVFGIKIPGKGWSVHPSGWHDLAQFLSTSDNRYQVRLGFLGLAKSEPDRPADMTPGGPSQSNDESMDGGHSAWHHYPAFEEVDFRAAHPGRIRGLEQSKLAERLKAMYGIGIETGEVVHRRSFWTGDEQNDWESAGKTPLSQALEYTSPEAPDFEFNRIETPRQYINLLLGGGSNLWANVDFAGAFGTCALGSAVVPHITRLDAKLIKPTKERAESFENPALFYQGLRDVIDSASGTANPYLKATGGLAVLQGLQGVQHYAKTGTLGADGSGGNVSRIALALVRGDQKGSQSGLVISIVVEHATVGTASRWLGEFLVDNEQELRKLLGLR